MSHYILGPEVPGGLGSRTEAEHPPEDVRVELHFEFRDGLRLRAERRFPRRLRTALAVLQERAQLSLMAPWAR